MANAATQDTFDQFKDLYEAKLEDYDFMAQCESLAGLKRKLCASGRAVGVEECIWANDFEINTLASALKTHVLILDMQVRLPPRPPPRSIPRPTREPAVGGSALSTQLVLRWNAGGRGLGGCGAPQQARTGQKFVTIRPDLGQ